VYRTVVCYHPYLVSMLFADVLPLNLVTFSMFFILVTVKHHGNRNVGKHDIASSQASGRLPYTT